MGKKKIVKECISHKNVCEIPYHLDFTPIMMRKMKEYFKTDDLERSLGNYIYWLEPEPLNKKVDSHKFQDEFGVIWKDTELNRGYVLEHPLKKPSLKDYDFPSPFHKERFVGLDDKINEYKDLFVAVWFGDFFERAHFLRGLDNLLSDLILHPEFVEELLEKILEFNLGMIDQLANYNIDGLFLSDDYGMQHGLMMSPECWKRFIKPKLKIMIEKIKGYNIYSFLHSCGDISPIIPDLIEIGLDVLHPIQPEAMNITNLKRDYGRDICFYGGISTQGVLRWPDKMKVKDKIKRTVDIMSNDGGYILALAITIQHDIPIDNVLTIIEVANEYRNATCKKK